MGRRCASVSVRSAVLVESSRSQCLDEHVVTCRNPIRTRASEIGGGRDGPYLIQSGLLTEELLLAEVVWAHGLLRILAYYGEDCFGSSWCRCCPVERVPWRGGRRRDEVRWLAHRIWRLLDDLARIIRFPINLEPDGVPRNEVLTLLAKSQSRALETSGVELDCSQQRRRQANRRPIF